MSTYTKVRVEHEHEHKIVVYCTRNNITFKLLKTLYLLHFINFEKIESKHKKLVDLNVDLKQNKIPSGVCDKGTTKCLMM